MTHEGSVLTPNFGHRPATTTIEPTASTVKSKTKHKSKVPSSKASPSIENPKASQRSDVKKKEKCPSIQPGVNFKDSGNSPSFPSTLKPQRSSPPECLSSQIPNISNSDSSHESSNSQASNSTSNSDHTEVTPSSQSSTIPCSLGPPSSCDISSQKLNEPSSQSQKHHLNNELDANHTQKPVLVWPSFESLLNLSPHEILARFAPNPKSGSKRRTSAAPPIKKNDTRQKTPGRPDASLTNSSSIPESVDCGEILHGAQNTVNRQSVDSEKQARKSTPIPKINSSTSSSNQQPVLQHEQQSNLARSERVNDGSNKETILEQDVSSAHTVPPSKKRRRINHAQTTKSGETSGQQNCGSRSSSIQKITGTGERAHTYKTDSVNEKLTRPDEETSKASPIPESQPRNSAGRREQSIQQEPNSALSQSQETCQAQHTNGRKKHTAVESPASPPRKRRRSHKSTLQPCADDSEQTPNLPQPITQVAIPKPIPGNAKHEKVPSMNSYSSDKHGHHADPTPPMTHPPSISEKVKTHALEKSVPMTTGSILQSSIESQYQLNSTNLTRTIEPNLNQVWRPSDSAYTKKKDIFSECDKLSNLDPENGTDSAKVRLQTYPTKFTNQSDRHHIGQVPLLTLEAETTPCREQSSHEKANRPQPPALMLQSPPNTSNKLYSAGTKMAESFPNSEARLLSSSIRQEEHRKVRELSQQPSLDMSETCSVSRSSQTSGAYFLLKKKERNKAKHKIKKLQKKLRGFSDRSVSTPLETPPSESFTLRAPSTQQSKCFSSTMTSPCSKATSDFNIRSRQSPPGSPINIPKHFGRWELSLPSDREISKVVLARMNQFLDEAVCAGFAKPMFDNPTLAGTCISLSSPVSVSKELPTETKLSRPVLTPPPIHQPVDTTQTSCGGNPATGSRKFKFVKGRATSDRDPIMRSISGCSSSLSEDINNTVTMALSLEQAEPNSLKITLNDSQKHPVISCQNVDSASRSRFENGLSSVPISEQKQHSRKSQHLLQRADKDIGNPTITSNLKSKQPLPKSSDSSSEDSSEKSSEGSVNQADKTLSDKPDTTLRITSSSSSLNPVIQKPNQNPITLHAESTRSQNKSDRALATTSAPSSALPNPLNNRIYNGVPAKPEAPRSPGSSGENKSEESDDDLADKPKATITNRSTPSQFNFSPKQNQDQRPLQVLQRPTQNKVQPAPPSGSLDQSTDNPVAPLTSPIAANISSNVHDSRNRSIEDSGTSSEDESEESEELEEDSIDAPDSLLKLKSNPMNLESLTSHQKQDLPPQKNKQEKPRTAIRPGPNSQPAGIRAASFPASSPVDLISNNCHDLLADRQVSESSESNSEVESEDSDEDSVDQEYPNQTNRTIPLSPSSLIPKQKRDKELSYQKKSSHPTKSDSRTKINGASTLPGHQKLAMDRSAVPTVSGEVNPIKSHDNTLRNECTASTQKKDPSTLSRGGLSDAESTEKSDDNCAPPSAQRKLKSPSPESSSDSDPISSIDVSPETLVENPSQQIPSVSTGRHSLVGFDRRESMSVRRKTLDAFRPLDFTSNRLSSKPVNNLPDRSEELKDRINHGSKEDHDSSSGVEESDSSSSSDTESDKGKNDDRLTLMKNSGLPAHKLAGVSAPITQKQRKSRSSLAKLWAKEEAKISSARRSNQRAY